MSNAQRAIAASPPPPMAQSQGRIVTDAEVSKALDWLRDNAKELGDARARCIRASHMVKVEKALEMKAHNQLPVSQQEREALASERYKDALNEDARIFPPMLQRFEAAGNMFRAGATVDDVVRKLGLSHYIAKAIKGRVAPDYRMKTLLPERTDE